MSLVSTVGAIWVTTTGDCPMSLELESLMNSGVADSDDWLESQGFLNVWGATGRPPPTRGPTPAR